MGFSIGYGFGILGWLVVAAIVAAAGIGIIFLLSASNLARREIVEEERDEGHDTPVG